jgi:SnoaL-like domain
LAGLSEADNRLMDLLSAIRGRDREALAALVADDVVFYSPATTYRGRDQVVDMLAFIGTVLEEVTATRQVETVTFIKGNSEGEHLDGVLVEVIDADGRIAEITLLLRPLATLQMAIRRLARAMAEGGQPGG